jgi:ABC-type glycerol-3-phosphate transport system substrate-binding protein
VLHLRRIIMLAAALAATAALGACGTETIDNCTLTAPNGDEVDVDVTLTDDEGGFEAVVPPQQ